MRGFHTYNIACAFERVALVFFFPSVMSFSASLCASLAFAHEVEIVSFSTRDVTRLRRRACRCAEVRPRWRCLIELMVNIASGQVGCKQCSICSRAFEQDAPCFQRVQGTFGVAVLVRKIYVRRLLVLDIGVTWRGNSTNGFVPASPPLALGAKEAFKFPLRLPSDVWWSD